MAWSPPPTPSSETERFIFYYFSIYAQLRVGRSRNRSNITNSASFTWFTWFLHPFPPPPPPPPPPPMCLCHNARNIFDDSPKKFKTKKKPIKPTKNPNEQKQKWDKKRNWKANEIVYLLNFSSTLPLLNEKRSNGHAARRRDSNEFRESGQELSRPGGDVTGVSHVSPIPRAPTSPNQYSNEAETTHPWASWGIRPPQRHLSSASAESTALHVSWEQIIYWFKTIIWLYTTSITMEWNN